VLGPERLRQEQLAVLVAVVAASLGRRLRSPETTALELALGQAGRDRQQPTLRDVVEALLRPTSEDAAAVASSSERLAEDGREAALALRGMCDGHLRGMFDGPTSEGLRLDGPLVSLDLSAVFHSEALGILMVCAAAWLQRTLARDTPPPPAGRDRRGLGHPPRPPDRALDGELLQALAGARRPDDRGLPPRQRPDRDRHRRL
jgi:hypothetical protein